MNNFEDTIPADFFCVRGEWMCGLFAAARGQLLLQDIASIIGILLGKKFAFQT